MSTQSHRKYNLGGATFLVLFYTPRVHLNKPFKNPCPMVSYTACSKVDRS